MSVSTPTGVLAPLTQASSTAQLFNNSRLDLFNRSVAFSTAYNRTSYAAEHNQVLSESRAFLLSFPDGDRSKQKDLNSYGSLVVWS